MIYSEMGIERGREMGIERETNQKKMGTQRERARIVSRQLRKIIKKLGKKNILLKYCVK